MQDGSVDPAEPAVRRACRRPGRGDASAAVSVCRAAAVREITRWDFDELVRHRVQWRAEAGDEASRWVAQKAGCEMALSGDRVAA